MAKKSITEASSELYSLLEPFESEERLMDKLSRSRTIEAWQSENSN